MASSMIEREEQANSVMRTDGRFAPAGGYNVGAPAKVCKRQQVRMKRRRLLVRQVLFRKESIHRGVTSCVAWGDPQGEA